MVNSTQAPEKRESAAQGQGVEHHRCQVPNALLQKGKQLVQKRKVATPATECEVELLEGGSIVSNEFKTKRRARENTGDENGRREGERETFTKAPSTGLVKEDDPRGSRESRREGAKREWERGQRPDTCTAEPRARERH